MIQRTEYYRKIIHIFNLVIPFTYLFFFESRFQVLRILVPLTVFAIVIEYLRVHSVIIKKIFNNTFENKVVFLTGHTGFQGSWLTLWLKLLGAKIIGFSQEPPTNPSMFKILELEKKIKHISGISLNFFLFLKLSYNHLRW